MSLRMWFDLRMGYLTTLSVAKAIWRPVLLFLEDELQSVTRDRRLACFWGSFQAFFYSNRFSTVIFRYGWKRQAYWARSKKYVLESCWVNALLARQNLRRNWLCQAGRTVIIRQSSLFQRTDHSNALCNVVSSFVHVGEVSHVEVIIYTQSCVQTARKISL